MLGQGRLKKTQKSPRNAAALHLDSFLKIFVPKAIATGGDASKYFGIKSNVSNRRI